MSCRWGAGLAAIQPDPRAKKKTMQSGPYQRCALPIGVCWSTFVKNKKKTWRFPLDVTQMWLLFVFLPCPVLLLCLKSVAFPCKPSISVSISKAGQFEKKKLQHETFHSSLSVSLSLRIYWFSLCRTNIAHFQNRYRCSNVESNRADAETQRVIQHQHAVRL